MVSNLAQGEQSATIFVPFSMAGPLDGLWELRSSIPQGIARVIFLVSDDILVPLSGFIKKTGRIPKRELSLARKRAADLRGKR